MFGKVDIAESTFVGNTSFRAGAIFSKVSEYKNAMTIVESTFNENMANERGGAIFSSDGIFTIKESILSNNVAKKNGGAIGHLDGDLIITSSTLSNNVAKKNGGAIWCRNKRQLELNDCIFEDNESDDIYEEKKIILVRYCKFNIFVILSDTNAI